MICLPRGRTVHAVQNRGARQSAEGDFDVSTYYFYSPSRDDDYRKTENRSETQ